MVEERDRETRKKDESENEDIKSTSLIPCQNCEEEKGLLK